MTTELDNERPAAAMTRPRPVRPDRRGARWPWWLLRALFTVQALATFLQPVFAGRFLAGGYGALAEHRTGADVVFALSLGQLVTVLLAWWPGRAPARLPLGMLALTVAVYEQLHAGFSRNLGLHIPLGVAIVVVTAWLLVWVWRHGPDRRRP